MPTPRIPTPRALVPVLVLLAAAAGRADAARWDTYNNANALNSITATRSVVWCASDFGVHRFDPASGTFRRYAKAPGELASNAVAEIAVDAAGDTWFATRGRGISVLRASGTWRTVDAFDGLPADSVNCLEATPEGMWVGTTEGVAVFRDFALEAAWPDGVNPSPFASNDVRDVLVVGDSVWVATPQGPYVTKADEGITWSRRTTGLGSVSVRSLAALGGETWCVAGGDVYRGGETGTWALAETGLPAGQVATLRAAGDVLLAGTATGVYTRTATTDWAPVGGGGPGSAWVTFDDEGAPWAGNVEGLWRWTGSTWTRHTSPGPLGNHVYGLAMEGSKVWIGTQFGGLSRFADDAWRTFLWTPGADIDTTMQSNDFLVGVFVDSDDDTWVGNWGKSIARVDDSGPTLAVTHHYGAEEGSFDAFNTFGWSAAEDPAGNVWIGLDTNNRGGTIPPKGVHRISPNGARATFSPQTGATGMSGNQVRAIAFGPGPAFEMWIGYAGQGVDIITDPTLATRVGRLTQGDANRNNALLSDDVWAIEMRGDSVWIATSGGIHRYSRALRARREAIQTQPPTSQGAVHPLAIDGEGGVWWGNTAGLYHRRPGQIVEVFNSFNSPLLSDIITSVDIDPNNGDVWIGTTSGVNRYDPDGQDTPTVPGGGAATFTSYPNPAFLSAAGVRIFGMTVEGAFEGLVHDVRGRVIRHLRGNASTTGLWDARDDDGNRCAPGLYFLSVTQSGVTRTGRVLLVR